MKVLKAVFALLVVPFPVFLPGTADAGTQIETAGAFTATVQITDVRLVDGNTIIAATETQTLTGSFAGTRVAHGIQIVHSDGSFEAHDSGTFTGTVNGSSGTVVISGSSTGVGNSGSGRLVVDRGTDDLAGLHGQGTFQPTITGPTTADGTYSVQIHFEP
jgi:hypothetical protein